MRKYLYISFMILLSTQLGCSSKKLKLEKEDAKKELFQDKEFSQAHRIEAIEPDLEVSKVEVPKLEKSRLEKSPVANSKSTTGSKKSEKQKQQVPSHSVTAEKTTSLNSTNVGKKDPAAPISSSYFINRKKSDFPIKVGEKTILSVRYMGIEAGKATIKVLPYKNIDGRKAFHLWAGGKTTGLFARMYPVEDAIETYWDAETLIPFFTALHGDELKKVYEVVTDYNWNDKTAKMLKKEWKPEKGVKTRKKKWKILDYAQDPMSAFFYLRTYKLEVGKTYDVPIADNGNNVILKTTVLRREKIRVKAGRFDAYVLKPVFLVNGKKKKKWDIEVWVTTDGNNHLLKAKAGFFWGAITAQAISLPKI